MNDTGKLTAYLLRPDLEKAGYSVDPKTQEIKVNGKKLFRLNYTDTAGQQPLYYSLFITRAHKSMLLMEFSAPDKATLEASLTTLQSLTITKPQKAK